MANNNKVSFDDIHLLKSFYTEGKFSSLSIKIKCLKDSMIALNENAKKAQKEHLNKLELEKKEVQQPAEVISAPKMEEKKLEQPKVQPKPETVEVKKQNNNFNNNRNNQNNQNNNQNFNRNRNFGVSQGQNQNGYNRFNNQNGNNQNRFNNNNRNNQNGGRPQFNKGGKPAFNKQVGGLKPNPQRPSFLNKPKFEKPAPIIVPQQPQRDFGNKKKGGTQYEEKKVYSKRDLLKRGMIDEENLEDRSLSRKIRPKKKEQETVKQVIKPSGPAIITTDNITVKVLSEATGKSVSEIIKNFMLLGMSVTINSSIDFETAELIANEMGVEIQQKLQKTSEEKLQDLQENIKAHLDENAVPRAPIVTVMGHVDHGKTSLLDYIRKSAVTSGEAGGITQHIGAYKVDVDGKSITFIDTPGHEAFTMMRARGASVTDVAILVVAADDGIMPQTVEAINHIKAAGVPMIVAINKMDKPQADPDRVMQQLAEHNVLPEAWGGDAIIVKISAHTGEGISKLLEMILLVAEMQELKANPDNPAMGTVLEARLDKGRGAIASLIVRDGSLKIGDTLVCGTALCKVKAMIDENNNNLKIATPSTPVSVLGFNEVPVAGDTFTVVDEKLSKEIIQERISKKRIEMAKMSSANTLEDLMAKTSEGNVKVLNILIKTDVGGTLEAIKASVLKLNNEEVKVNILHSGVSLT